MELTPVIELVANGHEWNPPTPNDVGHAVVAVDRIGGSALVDATHLDHDEPTGCFFLMCEGAGLEYWMDAHDVPDGVWVLEDITCHITPPMPSMGWDGDEEYDFGLRPATFEEIARGFGIDCNFWENT